MIWLLFGVVLRAALIDVVLSFLGPAYFGYMHDRYLAVVVWAIVCALVLLWRSRPARKRLVQAAYEADGVTVAQADSVVTRITFQLYVLIVTFLLTAHSVTYLVAEQFS